MLVSALFGHFSNYKKWFSLVVGNLDILFYSYLARELLYIFPHNDNTVVDLFTLCSAESPRRPWTFSIAGLISSMLAVDLPVFCLPLWGEVRYIQHRPSFQRLVNQPQLGWLVYEDLPCLRSKSKCFPNFVKVSEIDFVSA